MGKMWRFTIFNAVMGYFFWALQHCQLLRFYSVADRWWMSMKHWRNDTNMNTHISVPLTATKISHRLIWDWTCAHTKFWCFEDVAAFILKSPAQNKQNYRISQTIRCTFFPEKCDLKSTCVLYTEGKYLHPNLWMSLHLLYDIFIVR